MRASIVTGVVVALALCAWLLLREPGSAAQAPSGPPRAGAAVLIDLGHHNFGMTGNYAPLAQWLQAEGFPVRALRGPFERGTLEGVGLVVIKNALAERNAIANNATQGDMARAWSLPTPSAFTQAEIELLHDWVLGGGGLLLLVDHMPMPGAARELASAFGIEISNGHAVDERALQPFAAEKVERAGRIVFTRSDGTLADDPLTHGRSPSERVESVASDGGSAFRLPGQARSLLTLGPSFVSLLPQTAWQFSQATPRANVAGWSQGGVLRVGRGRLAVLGDGSLLMSPAMAASYGRWGAYTADGAPADFTQNARLLVNLVRWLSGRLGED